MFDYEWLPRLNDEYFDDCFVKYMKKFKAFNDVYKISVSCMYGLIEGIFIGIDTDVAGYTEHIRSYKTHIHHEKIIYLS